MRDSRINKSSFYYILHINISCSFMYQILILSSGTMSYRNTSEGSWYIQEICQVFFKNAAKMDVLHMLTQVNEHLLETVFMSAPPELWETGLAYCFIAMGICFNQLLSTQHPCMF